MKVKELIEELEKQNPAAKVMVKNHNGYYVETKEVSGNPASCAVDVRIN
jgi:cystathionine beta-lyase family protein involved in aluminum resistance